MEAALDTGFSLSYRDHVLRFLFPLFPRLTIGEGSAHVHALTRLLVTLSDVSLTVPLLSSLVEKEKLLAYQLAFDLVEGGSQDYLESIRSELPDGDLVRFYAVHSRSQLIHLVYSSPENKGSLRQASRYSDGKRIRKIVP